MDEEQLRAMIIEQVLKEHGASFGPPDFSDIPTSPGLSGFDMGMSPYKGRRTGDFQLEPDPLKVGPPGVYKSTMSPLQTGRGGSYKPMGPPDRSPKHTCLLYTSPSPRDS